MTRARSRADVGLTVTTSWRTERCVFLPGAIVLWSWWGEGRTLKIVHRKHQGAAGWRWADTVHVLDTDCRSSREITPIGLRLHNPNGKYHVTRLWRSGDALDDMCRLGGVAFDVISRARAGAPDQLAELSPRDQSTTFAFRRNPYLLAALTSTSRHDGLGRLGQE